MEAPGENLNNRLIINNADNDHPLIFGEFDNSKVVINGSITVTNGINASNKTITNVSDPVNSTDAATKAYVDSKIPPHYVGELYGGGDLITAMQGHCFPAESGQGNWHFSIKGRLL